MMQMCCDELRRNAVAGHPVLNGIDAIEVLDRDAPAGSPRQQTLLVHCLKPVPPLTAANVSIVGGDRVRNVRVLWAAPALLVSATVAAAAERALFTALADADRVLVVRTSSTGDFSQYVLGLVASPGDPNPPDTFDPRLASIAFSFKVECPSEFDCQATTECPPPAGADLDIDYLAKDYATFRRLILDRLAQLLPGWRASHAADLGVALAELLAYAGDHLSYEQDAIATEAYLGTARRRASVRRHALLVDYRLHDGCNARAWVVVSIVAPRLELKRADTRFLTRVPEFSNRIAPDSPELAEVLDARRADVFEPLHDATLFLEHNTMHVYTWGDRRCCVPRGATRTTLADHYPNLAPGDVLIFEEMKGPLTDEPEDAAPAHRHAVRLTSARAMDQGAPLRDPLTDQLITEIAWHAEDALPFPLCISSRTDVEHGNRDIQNVSVAHGNVVLADHGQSVPGGNRWEPIGVVPPPRLFGPPADPDRCGQRRPVPLPARFRPALGGAPLTHAGTISKTDVVDGQRLTTRLAFDPAGSARSAFAWRMDDVFPAVAAVGDPRDGTWEPRRDLLTSDGHMPHFVVEVQDDGTAVLRFGDDEYGKQPAPATEFRARYRIGNGSAGNVGAEAIAHVVTPESAIERVRNPRPAEGGADPERMDDARRRAPHAFRTRQERAVTPDDYARATELDSDVQAATARLRWTGSWHTMFVAVDRAGGREVERAYLDELRERLERYRLAGHDVDFEPARFVPLELDVHVCARPGFFRNEVKAALLHILSNRTLADGTRGLFHPDSLTFGQTVYLSPIYAAVHRVPGVASVEITKFQRRGIDDRAALDAGAMTFGTLEIPQLDNDPDFPERGVVRVAVDGGQ
jgi:hypothetical protein